MTICRKLIFSLLLFFTSAVASSFEPPLPFTFQLSDIPGSYSRKSAESTSFIDSGLSIRNHEKAHYQPMQEWDESQYLEYAYWEESEKGSIVNFMNFRVAFPLNFKKKNRYTQYPAIVMLHGTGGSGRKDDSGFDFTPSHPYYDSNSKQLFNPGLSHLQAVNRPKDHPQAFPGIVIAPQSSYNGSWGQKERFMVIQFVEWMIRAYNIDPDRIAIHGLSNGAKGVWKTAAERPDLFSAVLPMSGVGTDIDSMTMILSTTPMWIFQGDQDTNPSMSYSRKWYDALVAKGGMPRYTLYENTGHRTWPKAYAEPDFFSWIRSRNIRNVQIMGGDPREDSCGSMPEVVELGFTAGFLAYQWVRDGEEISGATERFFTADEDGIYYVKFKRRTDSTWGRSFVKDIFYNRSHLSEFTPSLEANGSTTLPAYGEDNSLKLIAEPGFISYEWYKDGDLIEDFSAEELVLNNVEGDAFQLADTGAYTVKVIDACGRTSLLSEPVRVLFDSARLLSVNEPEVAEPNVYPNPFHQIVNVKFPDNFHRDQYLEIYDPSGKKLIHEMITEQNITLDLSAIKPGIYLLVIGKVKKRIVKVAD